MPISLKTAVKSAYGDKKSKQKILNEGYVKDKKLSSANQKVFLIQILIHYYLMLQEAEQQKTLSIMILCWQ